MATIILSFNWLLYPGASVSLRLVVARPGYLTFCTDTSNNWGEGGGLKSYNG